MYDDELTPKDKYFLIKAKEAATREKRQRLQLRKEKGDLIPRRTFDKIWDNVIDIVIRFFETVPDRVYDILKEDPDAALNAKREIEKEMDLCREELANVVEKILNSPSAQD